MGGLNIWHLLILAVVVMLLFGKGRLSDFMGDAAKGIKSFKKGLQDEEDQPVNRPITRLQAQPPLEPNKSDELQPAKDDRPQH